MAFGSWAYTAASTATGSITVTCTTGTPVSSITLDNGSNFASSSRNLKAGGAAVIAYGLYSDAGYSTAWGSGVNFPAAATYTATASAAVFNVYGKAPAGPTVPAGSYSDSVGVTVTYT
ncbi:MAG: spore coat U domain-containing protein [Candidatus Velthaea sp.]